MHTIRARNVGGDTLGWTGLGYPEITNTGGTFTTSNCDAISTYFSASELIGNK